MRSKLPLTIEVDALANVHSHLREKDMVPYFIKYNIQGGSDILLPMPNTVEGLTTAEKVADYHEHCKRMVPRGRKMTFVPTMLVNEQTEIDEIYRAAELGIYDVKLYPLNRTTNSKNGIRNYGKLLEAVRQCGRSGVRVHVHPEHPWMTYHNRDAEFAFLSIADIFMQETCATLFWEHGTDARCIPFWKEMATSERFFVTLTAHHLLTNEDLSFGDVRAVCKPPIKTEADRLAFIQLISEGHNWVMAGLDDAPHNAKTKHTLDGQCSCGAFTSPYGLALYAHALDAILESGRVKIFTNFTSRNARRALKIDARPRRVKLIRTQQRIQRSLDAGAWKVMPFWADKCMNWQILG